MRHYILESELKPSGDGLESHNVVLCQVGKVGNPHPFVTWDRVHPEDRTPYCGAGHYFSASQLPEAVEDYVARCDRHGLAPYPRTKPEPLKECPSTGSVVPIYEDPITQQKLEGKAILLACISEEDEDSMSRWMVQFQGDDMTVERSILRQRTPTPEGA